MDVLQHKLRDPTLRHVTITATRVSKDLSYAKVFYTLLDPAADDSVIKNSQQVFERISGYLRYQLAHTLTLRKVPHLHFVHDDQLIKGQRLASLIDHAIQS